MKIVLESAYLPFQKNDLRVASFYKVVSILSERLRYNKTPLEKEEHNWKDRS